MIKATLIDGRLPESTISGIIADNQRMQQVYAEREEYYQGRNRAILQQPAKEENVPDNRVTVPYARKIAMTVKNYLFARDPIYTSENKDYMDTIQKVFYVNDHQKKIGDVGLDLIIHGIGYKLFYTDTIGGMLIPRYSIVDLTEGVPVYSIDIEPQLIAFIRCFGVTDKSSKKTKKYVEVYYSDSIVYFTNDSALTIDASRPEVKHSYKGSVPAVIYGDDDQVGIFDSVKRLIDAVDIIMSADLNEIQRFEMLYLVMIGDKMPDDPAEAAKVLKRRIFELSDGAQMSFLEKHIDGEFNLKLLEKLQDMIHSLSGVPDFMSKDFAAESGIALLYKLMGFENTAADIEQEFYKGERESIDLINVLLYKAVNTQEFILKNPDKRIEISLVKNLPENVAAKLDDASKMLALGVSQETIFDYIPVVKNPDEEIARAGAEKKKAFDDFQSGLATRTDEPLEDETIEDMTTN